MVEKIDIGGKTFNLRHLGFNYGDKPGVYAFLRKEGDIWVILYVGETQSFRERLTDGLEQHTAYDRAVLDYRATHVATRVVAGGKTARLSLETHLRHQYEPICNAQ